MSSIIKLTLKYFALILLIFFYSCSSKEKSSGNETSGTPVVITYPTKASLTDYMSFNANTTFLKKEIVRSTFQGFIQKVYKNIGDYVKAGDVVFQIITKDAYATDSVRLKLSDEIFRGSVLLKGKTNGILTELNYNTGDFVTDGEQLAVISNPSSLAVLLNVPYQHISKIKLNSGCILIFPNGQKINGLISKSLPSVDPITQTQTFLVNFVDGTNIPANLNLEIKIPINVVKEAIVLPKSTIQANETLDKFWIMKLINDSTAIKIPVVKGIEIDSLIQIIQPKLKMNDRVIVEGAYGLPDTAKIMVKNK